MVVKLPAVIMKELVRIETSHRRVIHQPTQDHHKEVIMRDHNHLVYLVTIRTDLSVALMIHPPRKDVTTMILLEENEAERNMNKMIHRILMIAHRAVA